MQLKDKFKSELLTGVSPDCVEGFATQVDEALEPGRRLIAAVDNVRHVRCQNERDSVSDKKRDQDEE